MDGLTATHLSLICMTLTARIGWTDSHTCVSYLYGGWTDCHTFVSYLYDSKALVDCLPYIYLLFV